jgi:hypothetical protein
MEEVSVAHPVQIFIDRRSLLAGQSGLVGALASAYIDWSQQFGGETQDYLMRLFQFHTGTSDFDLSLKIDWVMGDTTQSINYLASGDADIAITYNTAAENCSLELSIATKHVYGFRDHFYLVGPE